MRCTYCKGTKAKKQFSFRDIFEDDYSLMNCDSCKGYFLDPQPTEEQLGRAYDETYYGTGDKKFNPFIESLIDQLRLRKAHTFSKLLANNAKVLDVGCGNGSFLSYIGRKGQYELHGIELEGKSAQRAGLLKEINLKIGALKKGDYPEKSFDMISLVHVFEHLPNPALLLDTITSIAKANSILYLELPNIESWQSRFFKGNWFHLDAPRHLVFFSRNQLKSLLAERGWNLEKEKYSSFQFNPYGVQQSFLNSLGIKRDVLYEKLKGNKEYSRDQNSLSMFFQFLFMVFSFPLFFLSDLIASVFKRGGTLKLYFRKID